jgi:regulator of ribonuclease activity A
VSFVTPDLCDENPELIAVVSPMFRNYGGHKAFHGEIVTVKCFEDNSVVKEQANEAGNGRVMVVDGGGSMRCALLGDLIAEKACENGWAGFVIYGCIRDVDAIAELNLGVQALNSIPIKSVRKGRGDLNIDITFGGVTFKPGHFVYADNNGVIVSPEALKLP